MNTKKLLVSFVMLFSILFFAAAASAAPLATISKVEVDGLNVNSNPAVVVGDVVNVRVEFNSLVNASDVTVEAQIEGNKKDVKAETSSFDVETGKEYARTLKLQVPFDLKDSLSDFVDLTVTVSGDGFKTEATYTLRVQRESFSANILSISVPQTVKPGEVFPVDVVLKNVGYNDLDDLFVTASISALGVQRKTFFGEIVAIECDKDKTAVQNYGVDINRKCNEDNTDTLNGRVFLQIPYNVKSGAYTISVQVENEDTTSSQTAQVVVKNSFSSGNFIVSGNQLLIVNPTNEVVVYRIIPEQSSTLSVDVSDSLVAVPAGSSKAVTVKASSSSREPQTYSVNVFSADGALIDVVDFTTSANAYQERSSSPIVVLTVILAIIFIILLVVLIVLIGKKPEKEEFGESYY